MITDKDAKEWQKMVDKLEKQNKKDIEKFRKKEASIGSFFKSCLSADEKKKLDKSKKKWYSNNMTNKDMTLQQLKEQKKELNEKLEHYEFNGPSEKVQELEDELFEVNDTIKKLG